MKHTVLQDTQVSYTIQNENAKYIIKCFSPVRIILTSAARVIIYLLVILYIILV